MSAIKNQEVRQQLTLLEQMDQDWRTNGIPNAYREKWNVNTNVGLWICGPACGAWLHSAILRTNSRSVLELGTSVGYSTIWLADAVSQTGGTVTTIEIEPFKVAEAREHLERSGLSIAVNLIEGDILTELRIWSTPIDFVFMDANKRGYLEQFHLIEPHLHEKSMVVADNILDMPEQVAEFLDAISSNPRYTLEILPIGHGIAVITHCQNPKNASQSLVI